MKTIYLFLLALIAPAFLPAQTITTIAGNGIDGYNGDNIAATDAQLAQPLGVAIDNTGNIYIADQQNNRIRKINTSGIITTIAGNNGIMFNGDNIAATAASLWAPSSVAVDKDGNVYFADADNDRVRKISTSGIITTITTEVSSPSEIAIDDSSNVYIADYGNHRVIKVDKTGTLTTVAGNGTTGNTGNGGPATNATLKAPYGVAIDKNGNIYIADNLNYNIRKVDKSGIITTFAGNGITLGDGIPATAAVTGNPIGVFADNYGNVFIAQEDCIRRVNASGIISTIAGSAFGFQDNCPATAGKMRTPFSVAADSLGNLYIADEGNSRIRKVSSARLAANNISGSSSVFISPNPATDRVNVQGLKNGAIALYSVIGQPVKEESITDHFSVALLPAGMYIIRLYDVRRQLVYQGKLIKN